MTARVLIVEDEALIAEDIARALRGCGHEVVEMVRSGEAAIAASRRVQPDLVLMDIMLDGEISGITAAAAIRDDPGTPIVFLSALNHQDMLNEAKKVGPAGFLVKPFKDADLDAAVRITVGNRTSSEAHPAETSPDAALGNESRLAKLVREKPSKAAVLDFLSSVQFGANLSRSDLELVARETIVQAITAGSVIESGQERALWPVIVYSGRLELIARYDRNSHFVAALIAPRDLLGLVRLNEICSSNICYRSSRDSIVLSIPPTVTDLLLERYPALLGVLYDVITSRLALLSNVAAVTAYGGAQERLARVLSGLVPRFSYRGAEPHSAILDVSKGELASLSGMALETVIRMLNDFEARGLVRPRGRKSIEVVNTQLISKILPHHEKQMFY